MSSGKIEASSAAVSWASVIGGAFVAASLSLILLSLGTGLGFSAVSPWTHNGASATAIGAGAIAWLIVTHQKTLAALEICGNTRLAFPEIIPKVVPVADLQDKTLICL